jgi:hypothetical protein
MKIKYSICTLFVGALALASCNNDLPTFNDADAFAAFSTTAYSVDENVSTGELDIPVTFASLAGLEASVDFSIADGATAIEGTNYKILNSSKTLSFTKEEPVQYIKIKVVDNDLYTGDLKFTINLSNPTNAKLGTVNSCEVKIADDEHPLAFILGTFAGTGVSDFGGDLAWTMKIEKDDADVTKVWFTNLVPAGGDLKVYGIVNADKTEVDIPVGQSIASPSSSYPHTYLEGWYGPEGATKIPVGGHITGKIAADGTISISDFYGSHVYKDDAASVSGGWYEIVDPIAVFKKQ